MKTKQRDWNRVLEVTIVSAIFGTMASLIIVPNYKEDKKSSAERAEVAAAVQAARALAEGRAREYDALEDQIEAEMASMKMAIGLLSESSLEEAGD